MKRGAAWAWVLLVLFLARPGAADPVTDALQQALVAVQDGDLATANKILDGMIESIKLMKESCDLDHKDGNIWSKRGC